MLMAVKKAMWAYGVPVLIFGLIAAFGCLAADARNAQDPQSLPALINALTNSSPKVRAHAAETLGELRNRSAVNPLIAALSDSEPRVRTQAAYALSVIRDHRAADPLVRALQDSSPEVRAAAAEALGQLGDRGVVDLLIAALKDSNGRVRSSAAFALGQIKDDRAVDPLISVLHDSDDGVRALASLALGEIRDPRAAEPLLGMLQDSNPMAKANAATGLGLIGYEGALDPLIALLKDPDYIARWSAAGALGDIKDPRAVTPLIAALSRRDAFMDKTVGESLAKIGEPAIEPLLAALNDADANTRLGAANAFAQMHVPSAAADRISKALIALLNDKDPAVRSSADWALVNNRTQLHSIESLIAALKDPDAGIRRDAAKVLGETQDRHAIQPLTDALKDADLGVREQATEALKAMDLAGTAGPPPKSDLDYRVISSLDLTGPFRTKTKWVFTVFQAPDTCNPQLDDGCNGSYEFCFVHLDKSRCTEIGGAVLDEASIISPERRPPLLVTATRPDVWTSGAGNLYIDFWTYRRNSDEFENVFSNRSNQNNNEETRFIRSGPLSGDIAVSRAPTRAPYHYDIVIYRPSKAGKYFEILKFTGKTRYGDGNQLAVIDSEMPEIERRLHLWRPEDPPPTPPEMPTRCTTVEMRNGVEWCP